MECNDCTSFWPRSEEPPRYDSCRGPLKLRVLFTILVTNSAVATPETLVLNAAPTATVAVSSRIIEFWPENTSVLTVFVVVTPVKPVTWVPLAIPVPERGEPTTAPPVPP